MDKLKDRSHGEHVHRCSMCKRVYVHVLQGCKESGRVCFCCRTYQAGKVAFCKGK